jgi:hypothetical protein
VFRTTVKVVGPLHANTEEDGEEVKRNITLTVEVANDDQYSDVIQRAHALEHVIDIRWTAHKGQEGLLALVQTGPLGLGSKWSTLSLARFGALRDEIAAEQERRHEPVDADIEAFDADMQAFTDAAVEMIGEGVLDPHISRIVRAVDERLTVQASAQRAARLATGE